MIGSYKAFMSLWITRSAIAIAAAIIRVYCFFYCVTVAKALIHMERLLQFHLLLTVLNLALISGVKRPH